MCSFNYNYYIVYCWHMNLDRHTHTHMNVTQLQCNLMCKRDVRYRNNLKCSQKSLICLAHSVAWNMQFVFYSKRVKRKLNYFSYLRFGFYLQKKKINISSFNKTECFAWWRDANNRTTNPFFQLLLNVGHLSREKTEESACLLGSPSSYVVGGCPGGRRWVNKTRQIKQMEIERLRRERYMTVWLCVCV